MPFKSKKQARWMYANKPQMAKEWSAHTPSINSLPERKKKAHSMPRKHAKREGY